MALQRRAHGALTAWSTSQAVPYSASATAGDACFLIAENLAAIGTAPAGWTEIAAGGPAGLYYKKVFRLNGDYTGTPAMPTVTAAGGSGGATYIEHWYDDGGLAIDSSVALVALDTTLTSTAFSATGTSITTATGDTLFAALALKSETTMTAAPTGIVLSQAGATLGTQVGNFGTRTITGITPATSLHVGTYHKPVTAGGTGAPSLTATGGTGATNVGGLAAFIRLRGVTANIPPVANAGTDQTVTVGTLVTLNGTGSSDPDGTIASYLWSQTAGTAVTLSSTTVASPTFTPATSGARTFQLQVTDDDGATHTDTVFITVNAANVPPTANAGTDQDVSIGALVTLNGTGSTDPDGTIASYAWTQTSGTAVTLSSSSVASPTFTPGTSGVRTFDLVVTDDDGAVSSADSVTITVSAGNTASNSGTSGTTLSVNKPAGLADGDLLGIAVYKQSPGTTFTTPSTFTEAYHAVASGTRGLALFAKKVTTASGEPSSYSITSSDSGSRWIAVSFRLAGVDTAWLDAAPTSDAYTGSSSGSVVDPSVTAVAAPTIALAVNFSNNSTAVYQSFTSSGWATLVNATVTSGASTSVLDVASKTLSSAGATGTTTFAMSPTAASSGGFQLTLKLAGANILPIANAGTDQTVTTGTLVTLNGSGSSDPDGTIASYAWTQTAGTAVTLSSASVASPTFTPATSGVRTFDLVVTDDDGGTATDSVSVTVTAPSAGTVSYVGLGGAGTLATSGLFTYPTGLEAGDMCIAYAHSNVVPPATLSGWNEAGPLVTAGGVNARAWYRIVAGTEDGTTFTYSGVTGGSKGIVLMNAFRSSTGFFALPVDVSGTDVDASTLAFAAAGGAADSEIGDRVASSLAAFAVSATFTGAPTGQTITQAGGTVSTTARSGSGSSSGGTISYGTADADVTAASSGAFSYAANTVGSTAVGVARMLLLRASSTPSNIPPTANAGTDQTVTTGVLVTLNGTGSTDPDGTIASYAWTQTSGTTVTLSSSSVASPTFTPATSGVRVFRLVVTDDDGAISAADTVTITVNAPPTANAGPDQTAGVGTLVSLDGTGSNDPDGTIASYLWTQISGTAVTLAPSTGAVAPTFTPATAGVRVFGLVVTDNLGAVSAQDTVTITVAVGDTANAGVDQTVSAWDTVTLFGTGTAPGTWSQVSGAAVTLVGSGTIRTFKAVPSNTPGTSVVRVFRYTVGTATDDVTFTTATATLFYGAPGAYKAAEFSYELATPNLLIGKTFTSDVTESISEPGHLISYLTDQTLGTRWISQPASPVNITVNLNGVYDLTKLVIVFAADTIKNYVVSISTNGTTFTPIATGITNNTMQQAVTITGFTSTPKGRYLRITGTDRWNTTWGNSIWEVEAYGVLDTSSPTGAISAFDAVTVSNTQINLTWAYSGSTLTNYTLTRNGVTIASPAAGVTSYSDTGRTAGTPYTYTLIGNFAAGGVTNMVSDSATTTGGVTGAWLSGASCIGAGDEATFGSWRGTPLESGTTWSDVNWTAMEALWQFDSGGQYYNFQGTVDLSPGAIYSGMTWGQAATGAADAHWTTFWNTLKTKWTRISRTGNICVRFAHEMNGNWYDWSVSAADIANFKTAWIRFANLRNSIFPAAKLVFGTNGNTVGQSYDWRTLWPGDSYVDIYAVDWYGGHYKTAVTNGTTVDANGGPIALTGHRDFALAHGKPIAIPEWGVDHTYGNGDDVAYVQYIYDFGTTYGGTGAGNLLYENYFNLSAGYSNDFQLYYPGSGNSPSNPLSSARYVLRF